MKEEKTKNKRKVMPPNNGKPGPPPGVSNNPNGRPKGSKNKIQYDIRKLIYKHVNKEDFVDDLFGDIAMVDEPDKRAKLKIELVKLFVPRPMNDDEIEEKHVRSAIFSKLAGEIEDVED